MLLNDVVEDGVLLNDAVVEGDGVEVRVADGVVLAVPDAVFVLLALVVLEGEGVGLGVGVLVLDTDGHVSTPPHTPHAHSPMHPGAGPTVAHGTESSTLRSDCTPTRASHTSTEHASYALSSSSAGSRLDPLATHVPEGH